MNSTSFKLTVIIPAYNASKYIELTLKSILNQTIPPSEVIVINDGSCDNTCEIVSKFPVKLITQKNLGPAHARNKGIFESTGDWIAFIDADDLWAVNKIEIIYDEINRFPDVEMFSTNFLTGNEIDGWKPSNPNKKFNQDLNFFNQLYRRSFIATSSVVIKKDVFNRLGGFNPHFFGPEDLDMWLRIALNDTKFKFIDKDLLFYRIHRDSITANLYKPYRDTKKVFFRYRLHVSYFLFTTRIAILNIVTLSSLIKQKQIKTALMLSIQTLIDIIRSPYDYYRL